MPRKGELRFRISDMNFGGALPGTGCKIGETILGSENQTIFCDQS